MRSRHETAELAYGSWWAPVLLHGGCDVRTIAPAAFTRLATRRRRPVRPRRARNTVDAGSRWSSASSVRSACAPPVGRCRWASPPSRAAPRPRLIPPRRGRLPWIGPAGPGAAELQAGCKRRRRPYRQHTADHTIRSNSGGRQPQAIRSRHDNSPRPCARTATSARAPLLPASRRPRVAVKRARHNRRSFPGESEPTRARSIRS
jgi:hypothetical protein